MIVDRCVHPGGHNDPRSGLSLAGGVCHTDAIARDGDMPFPAPGVLGHEGAGIVAAVGSGVTSVAVGDKVVIGWPWCGSCRNCLEGQPRYCLDLGPLVLRGGGGGRATAVGGRTGRRRCGGWTGRRSTATSSRSGDVIKPVLRMPE